MSTFSLIIPVYNEERHIRACLDAVSVQSVMPDEVIVVDNNSTDKTVAIAESYPFVRVITEKKQGRAHARSAGFRSAQGEILGRIDADSRIAVNWVETAKIRFENDQTLMGLSGLGATSTLPILQLFRTTLWSRCYFWFVHASFHTITMWGANMAVRASAWRAVENLVVNDDRLVHEDQDISLWIGSKVGKIEQDADLHITTNGQTYRFLPKLILYHHLFHKTKQLHKKNGNLTQSKLIKLSFWRTLPGALASLLLGVPLVVMSFVMFPLDLVMVKVFRSHAWLD